MTKEQGIEWLKDRTQFAKGTVSVTVGERIWDHGRLQGTQYSAQAGLHIGGECWTSDEPTIREAIESVLKQWQVAK